MTQNHFITDISKFVKDVDMAIGSKDTNVDTVYVLVRRSEGIEFFLSHTSLYHSPRMHKKEFDKYYQMKKDADKRLTQFRENSKQELVNQSKDTHNKELRHFNKRYRRDSWEFECSLEEIETEDMIGAREWAHNFIEFCKKEWGLVFDPQVIKDLREIDHIVIELVRRNKNGKVIFNELKSYPKSHWWWHLNELNKLSKEDLETI